MQIEIFAISIFAIIEKSHFSLAALNVTRFWPTIDTVKLEWNAKYKLTLKRCSILISNETLSLTKKDL